MTRLLAKFVECKVMPEVSIVAKLKVVSVNEPPYS